MNRRRTTDNLAARLSKRTHRQDVAKIRRRGICGSFEFWMYALLKQAGMNVSVLEPGDEKTPDFHAEDENAKCDIEVTVTTAPKLLTDAETKLNNLARSCHYDGWFVSWQITGELTQSIGRKKIERIEHEFGAVLASNPTKGEVATVYQGDTCSVITTFVRHYDGSKGGIMLYRAVMRTSSKARSVSRKS